MFPKVATEPGEEERSQTQVIALPKQPNIFLNVQKLKITKMEMGPSWGLT